jgi:hypothetical protein
MVNEMPVAVQQHRFSAMSLPQSFHNSALVNPHLNSNFHLNRAGLISILPVPRKGTPRRDLVSE